MPSHPVPSRAIRSQVAELKEELEKLGEPTDGLKAALVKRLTKALSENKVSAVVNHTA